MTKFQLGILVGCFLGALTMFVVLGIIQLYLAEHQEKRVRARERTAREIQAAIGARSYANPEAPDHLPFLAVKEPGTEEDTIICYLSIHLE
jgi:hypothetical protein